MSGSDLEMLKLCAEAMGLRLLRPLGKGAMFYVEGEREWNGLLRSREGNHLFVESGAYDPLHNDAQAMALVKKFGMRLWKQYRDGVDNWAASVFIRHTPTQGEHIDLNRAIVECAAKMQRAKQSD